MAHGGMIDIVNERVLAEWTDSETGEICTLGSVLLINKQGTMFTLKVGLDAGQAFIRFCLTVSLRVARRTRSRELLFVIPLQTFTTVSPGLTFEVINASNIHTSAVFSAIREAGLCECDQIIHLQFNLQESGYVLMPATSAKSMRASNTTSSDLLRGLKSLSKAHTFSVYMKPSDYARQGLKAVCERFSTLRQLPVDLTTLYGERSAALIEWDLVQLRDERAQRQSDEGCLPPPYKEKDAGTPSSPYNRRKDEAAIPPLVPRTPMPGEEMAPASQIRLVGSPGHNDSFVAETPGENGEMGFWGQIGAYPLDHASSSGEKTESIFTLSPFLEHQPYLPPSPLLEQQPNPISSPFLDLYPKFPPSPALELGSDSLLSPALGLQSGIQRRKRSQMSRTSSFDHTEELTKRAVVGSPTRSCLQAQQASPVTPVLPIRDPTCPRSFRATAPSSATSRAENVGPTACKPAAPHTLQFSLSPTPAPASATSIATSIPSPSSQAPSQGIDPDLELELRSTRLTLEIAEWTNRALTVNKDVFTHSRLQRWFRAMGQAAREGAEAEFKESRVRCSAGWFWDPEDADRTQDAEELSDDGMEDAHETEKADDTAAMGAIQDMAVLIRWAYSLDSYADIIMQAEFLRLGHAARTAVQAGGGFCSEEYRRQKAVCVGCALRMFGKMEA